MVLFRRLDRSRKGFILDAGNKKLRNCCAPAATGGVGISVMVGSVTVEYSNGIMVARRSYSPLLWLRRIPAVRRLIPFNMSLAN